MEDVEQAAETALLGLGDCDKHTVSTAHYHLHSCFVEAGTSTA